MGPRLRGGDGLGYFMPRGLSLQPGLQFLGIQEDMQRAGARAAGRELVEQHPGVVFHLFQLAQQIRVLHARKLAKAIPGRSRRGPKLASLFGDRWRPVENFPLVNQRRAASISSAPITTPTPKPTPTAVQGFCCTCSSA